MAKKNPLEKFENESRLLSDDEQELIRVLASFNQAIQDLRQRMEALEAESQIYGHALGGLLIGAQKKDD